MQRESNGRVLIVDDDHDVRSVLAAALRQRSLVTDEASDGTSALELLSANTYTVVLLDLMSPRLDGLRVLEAIDAGAIVLVVSSAERSLLAGLDPARIHGVVRKPFDPVDLATIVASCAELRGRSPFQTMALATMLSGAPLITLL